MKYRSYICSLLIFLIFSFFISGCNPDQSRTLELSVVHEFTLSKKTQEYLHRMYTDIVSNPKAQEIAFSNYTSPISVIITDYEGKFVEQIGQEGRGPKEILSARYLGFDNQQNLVILDKSGAFFKHFNRTTKEVDVYESPVKQGVTVTTRNLKMCGNRWYLGIQLLAKSPRPTVPIIGVFDNKFNMVDTLGGYDPFFQGRDGIMKGTVIKVDCEGKRVYTTHAKVPYIQVYSIEDGKRIGHTTNIPASFMLSDKFITMVSNPREMTRYLSEEQSMSLNLSYTDKYIYHVFRNERNTYARRRKLNNSDHFAAVYDKKSLEYLGEVKLPGAVLGSTNEGELIVLKNQQTFEIQFVKIYTVSESVE